jgi:hypothetical protein
MSASSQFRGPRGPRGCHPTAELVPTRCVWPGPGDGVPAEKPGRGNAKRRWRNWQTRQIQVLVSERTWRFKSSSSHKARLVMAGAAQARPTLPREGDFERRGPGRALADSGGPGVEAAFVCRGPVERCAEPRSRRWLAARRDIAARGSSCGAPSGGLVCTSWRQRSGSIGRAASPEQYRCAFSVSEGERTACTRVSGSR